MSQSYSKILLIECILEELDVNNRLLSLSECNDILSYYHISAKEYATVIQIMLQGGLVVGITISPVPYDSRQHSRHRYHSLNTDEEQTVIINGSNAMISLLGLEFLRNHNA